MPALAGFVETKKPAQAGFFFGAFDYRWLMVGVGFNRTVGTPCPRGSMISV